MEEQRRRTQEASKFGVDMHGGTTVDARTAFQGYEGLEAEGRVDELRNGEEGEVVLDRTPFYAEAGGQVGDTGTLTGAGMSFPVRDTVKRGAAHSHLGRVSEGKIRVGDAVRAQVDGERRRAIALNHTATHLLHAA